MLALGCFCTFATVAWSPAMAETDPARDCAEVSARIELCSTADWRFVSDSMDERSLVNASEDALKNGPSDRIAILRADFIADHSWRTNTAVSGLAKLMFFYFDSGACGGEARIPLDCEIVLRNSLFQSPHIRARGFQHEDNFLSELLVIVSAEGIHMFIAGGGAEDSAMKDLDADALFASVIGKRN